MALVSNPILPGFHPDPTICRANGKYYLACSSFAYFPGVPIFESEDLANWRQIGNALTRDSQVPLCGAGVSEGIYAPTLRFRDGIFYLVTTNLPEMGNFIVTAKDPAGPWSEPHYLKGACGIDPSLFFDDDGKCWYVGQRERSAGWYFGDCEIYLSCLDLYSMRLTGPQVVLARGFQRRAIWPEGPHIYKRDGWYYLLHAEGGTGSDHSVMAARSRFVSGPYEYCKANPILTHRHLGRSSPVTCVGHADMAEDGRGNWYMVCLGCRPEDGYTMLGRETFLARVEWEDGWPVVNPGVGRLEEEVELSSAGAEPAISGARRYSFTDSALPMEVLTLRNSRSKTVSLTERPGFLRLQMARDSLGDPGDPAYAAVRVCHKRFDAEGRLEAGFPEGCSAGLALVQNEKNRLRIEYLSMGTGGILRAVRTVMGEDVTMGAMPAPDEKDVVIKLAVRGLWADALYFDGVVWQTLCRDVDIRALSTQLAGGFVGCTVGMFAVGDGTGHADFKSFAYEPII